MPDVNRAPSPRPRPSGDASEIDRRAAFVDGPRVSAPPVAVPQIGDEPPPPPRYGCLSTFPIDRER